MIIWIKSPHRKLRSAHLSFQGPIGVGYDGMKWWNDDSNNGLQNRKDGPKVIRPDGHKRFDLYIHEAL